VDSCRWQLVSEEPSSGQDLVADPSVSPAYRDETLVTRIGSLHADHASPGEYASGPATSSSMSPGRIVAMLRLLDPAPKHRVLDIGTGCGYPAALLGRRVGDAQLTSIDSDPERVLVARERLAEFGLQPRIECADPALPLPGGDYDRIVATVAPRPLPAGWLRALRPGGRLVARLAGTSMLLVVDLGRDGVARGAVHHDPACLTRVRHGADRPPRLHHVYASACDQRGEDVRRLRAPAPDLSLDWPLRSLFELASPDVEHRSAVLDDGRTISWLLGADGAWARVEQGPGGVGTVHQSGPRQLWDDLERVEARWNGSGRFLPDQLGVELRSDGGVLTSPDGCWRVRL
jgi:protein-L-isoaspartate O-methyltransferase